MNCFRPFKHKTKEKKMSVNKTLLLGRLGRDPETKALATGTTICNFSVATDESWTDKQGQKQSKTEWHKIVVFGKLAEVCGQYLSKGREVFVEGKNQTRSYDNKEGVKVYVTEVNATSVQFIGGEKTGNNTPNTSDIPF